MLSKKQAKDKVAAINSAMEYLKGKPVQVKLGPHSFHLQLKDITVPVLADLALQPDKVYNEETGKYVTPSILQFKFFTGESINVVLDDLSDFTVGVNGATFKIGDQELFIGYDS